MKILILSCGTGGGHDSAANAMLECFNELKIDCEVMNPIELTSKRMAKGVNESYLKIVNNIPKMFKNIYHLGELYSKLPIKSPIYSFNNLFAKKLKEYIFNNNIDYVICTHLYPAETLTYLKKKNINIHFILVATDYALIPFFKETNPDYYVLPAKKLVKEYINTGIDKKKILPFGIPVSIKFNINYKKDELKKQLSIPSNKKTILIMSGSMGYGKLDTMIEKIYNKYKNKINIIVICGNNKKLKDNLYHKYKENIILKGFTNNVNMYMKASDLLLTKPGGLTSTESAVSNIPTIFTDPIPGCENYNAEFFENNGMGYYLTSIDDLENYVDTLLYNKKVINKIKKNQSKIINKNSTKDICNFVINKCKK